MGARSVLTQQLGVFRRFVELKQYDNRLSPTYFNVFWGSGLILWKLIIKSPKSCAMYARAVLRLSLILKHIILLVLAIGLQVFSFTGQLQQHSSPTHLRFERVSCLAFEFLFCLILCTKKGPLFTFMGA